MLDNYNERLFNGKSIRSKLHLSRYIWLQKKIKKYKCRLDSVLELGCFDGKTIEFLEEKPKMFEGYDANWEGGLDTGKKKWQDFPDYVFKLCTKLEDFKPEQNKFDISICQETAEHLPETDLPQYLERMANATKTYCFLSVPNERGIIFLAKHFTKFLTQKKDERENVTAREFYYSAVGNLKQIKRNVKHHKGFDYKQFKKDVEKSFEIVEVNGLPFSFLPPSLNFTVGFVCKKKNAQ